MDMEITLDTVPMIPTGVLDRANNLPRRRPRFMLDRDRIFYSPAFRRLAGKTQLLAAGQDELLRTRLTHTLEVSQIARAVGQALGLDLDLIEAIVLGHDLGHTPFGHVGERTLHEIMTPDPQHILGSRCPLRSEQAGEKWAGFLGFKHNLQSLVVAMELEKSTGGRGLGLTKYTLYGLQAHTKPRYKKGRIANHDMLGYYDRYLETGCKRNGAWVWSLEALLVAQADEIAQWHHDLEDALRAGLVSPQEAVQTLEPMLYYRREKLSPQEQAVLRRPGDWDLERFIPVFTRVVVGTLMDALTETAQDNILRRGGIVPAETPADSKIPHVTQTRPEQPDTEIFSFGDKTVYGSFACAVEAFGEKIGGGILQRPEITKADEKGRRIIQKLFRGYYRHPEKLPEEAVYAFFSACYALREDKKLSKCLRAELLEGSEEQLHREANRENGTPITDRFRQVFGKRNSTSELEELLLMRCICNHIASMTDAEAKRAAAQFRG